MKSKDEKNRIIWIRNISFIILLIIIYSLFNVSSNRIINYPQNLLYSTWVAFCCLNFLINIKKLRAKFSLIKKNFIIITLFLSSNLIKIAIVSLVFTNVIFIPFNFYNIYKASENEVFIERVKIEQLVAKARKRNNKIFFKYKGRMNVIKGHKPIMNDIYNKNDIRNYYLTLEIRKGLLESYVLNDWYILLNDQNEKK